MLHHGFGSLRPGIVISIVILLLLRLGHLVEMLMIKLIICTLAALLHIVLLNRIVRKITATIVELVIRLVLGQSLLSMR